MTQIEIWIDRIMQRMFKMSPRHIRRFIGNPYELPPTDRVRRKARDLDQFIACRIPAIDEAIDISLEAALRRAVMRHKMSISARKRKRDKKGRFR